MRIDGINAYGRGDLAEAIQVMATGQVDVTPLISRILPLESAAAGFEMLTSPKPGVVKILLAPAGSPKGI
ncbi:MAG: hypothetical protein BWY80_01156 [Firmicutes bacterium ADurb.Bin456]|nr:MAG: hypothetical protein BWY80_01156 [Firmicutes bacterium ADurb.Bin456]